MSPTGFRVLTCAGCHEFSNEDKNLGTTKPWPKKKLDFVHQSERDGDLEDGPDGAKTRFGLSETLKELLIPDRVDVMTLFLSKFPRPAAGSTK